MSLKTDAPYLVLGLIGVLFAGIVLVGILVAAAFVGFGGGTSTADTTNSQSCGSIATVNSPIKIPYPNTKLGLEGHLDDVHPKHFVGPDSKDPSGNIAMAGGPGAYPPHTEDQEHWYFNEYWPDDSIAHKRLLIQSTQTKKCVVVSVEEKGPAAFVTARDGVGAGAPPEVLNALGLKLDAAYDGNPHSDNNRITVRYIKDQKTALGPTK